MATEKIMVMMTCNYGGSLYLLWLGSARSSFCLSLPLLLPSPPLPYNQKIFLKIKIVARVVWRDRARSVDEKN